MGSLSPRTRNAQVALYQSGEVDFLVATDAIGMGLNMDVDHVAFAGLRKFDGKRTRWLHAAGDRPDRRPRRPLPRDGTFGVTGECRGHGRDLVEAVENHRFEPVAGAEWRNAELDFGSPARPAALAGRAAATATGLKLAAEALDETTLRQLAEDEDVADRRPRPRQPDAPVGRLPDAGLPQDHAATSTCGLARTFFQHLTAGAAGASPRTGSRGQFDAASTAPTARSTPWPRRLASVRTLAYVANRPDWLADPADWQGRPRALEDRLSDTLHEKLMARFVDRRTSALMRGLRRARGDAGRRRAPTAR